MSAAKGECVVKLLMLGDTNTGKTSLLLRFCAGKFESNFVTTIGVDFKSKQVERNHRKLNLQVWDTAGQEKFQTITPAYYHAAMGVVITYDVTDKNSFDHIEDWINRLAQHGHEKVQRILVGNKADLEELRKVPTADGEALASKNNMLFFEASAKTGNNVEESFLQIADKVVEDRYPELGREDNPQQLGQDFEGNKNCKCW